MKILIINGYGKSVSGLKSFEQYRNIIRDVRFIFIQLLLGKREMIDTEIEFFIRDRDSLDELLYEIDSSFVRIECGKMFDSIDLIFFEGDANLRPWSPNAYKFLVLLRMCMRSNKILFASSFAMQGLVFLTASNVEQNIFVLNGLNGGQLGDLTKIKKNIHDIRQCDFFLDNVTGDLYSFNYDNGEWIGKGNAGLHYRRAAEEFKTIGKYIVKAPQYKVQRMKELDELYVSKENEVVCSLRKNQMHSYLFGGIPFEFVVPSKNSWDVHPFNFVNPKKTFQTLADCEKGPQIISISDNIIATQFAIRKKYKETVEILRNFMGYQLTKLCSGRSFAIPIELASIKQNDNAMDVYLEHMAKSKYSNQKTIKFNVITEFHHAGFAAKKSNGLDVVVNNAIGKRKFKQTVEKLNPKELNRLLEMNDLSGQQQPLPSIHSQQPTSTIIDDTPKEQFNKTASEIRLLLHPSIDRSNLTESRHMWVPGFLSMQNQNQNQSRTDLGKSRKKQNTIFEDTEGERNINYRIGKQFRCETPGKTEQTNRNSNLGQQFRTITKDRWVSDRDFKV